MDNEKDKEKKWFKKPEWWIVIFTIGAFLAACFYAEFTRRMSNENRKFVEVMIEEMRISIAPNTVPELISAPDLKIIDEINKLSDDIQFMKEELNKFNDKKERINEEIEMLSERTEKEELLDEKEDERDNLLKKIEDKEKVISEKEGEKNDKNEEFRSFMDYEVELINAEDNIALNVYGYIHDNNTFMSCKNSVNILLGGEDKKENLEFSLKNTTNKIEIESEIEKIWDEESSKIFDSDLFKDFVERQNNSALMIIYSDVKGTVYLTTRSIIRDETKNIKCGKINTIFIKQCKKTEIDHNHLTLINRLIKIYRFFNPLI